MQWNIGIDAKQERNRFADAPLVDRYDQILETGLVDQAQEFVKRNTPPSLPSLVASSGQRGQKWS